MTVLAEGSMTGSVAGLVVMGCGALFVALVVAGANLWLRWQRIRSRPQKIEPNTVESSTFYRRYLVAAAWAGGSTRNWDHSVRPVLSELVELSMAQRLASDEDLKAAARERLAELWPLVDRNSPRSDDQSTPGAGREALLQILDRLEKP